MSTRINTNVTALEAANNLNTNSNNLATNIQRLSSGLRINTAADDPAGLAISDNFKAQISGLTQATSNSNDAINEVKTAEGALNQVQNLLISLRQLAVQASNQGTNSSIDLQADQAQINSAISSINQIAATTQFGNKFLLSGAATTAATTTAGNAVATGNITLAAKGNYTAATAGTYNTVSITAATAATDTFNYQNTGTTALASTATGVYSGAIVINGTSYQLSTATTNTLTSLNAAIASSGYQASVGANGQLTFTNQTTGLLASNATFNTSGLTVGTNSLIGATTGNLAGTAFGAVNAAAATGALTGAATYQGAGSITIFYSNAATNYVNTSVTVAIAAAEAVSAVAAAVSTATNGGVTFGLDATGITLGAGSSGGTSFSYGNTANTITLTGQSEVTTKAQTASGGNFAQETVAASAGVGGATLTASSLFGGVITVTGSSTATYTIAPNTNLTGLNAVLASAGVGASVNGSGALIFANGVSSTIAPTVVLGAGFQAYNALTAAGSSPTTGAFSNGANAQLTLSNSTSTLTSNSTQTLNGTNFFNFSNGAVIATTVTAGGTLVGSLVSTAGTTSAGQALQFQVGANGGQTNNLAIQSVAANLLGNGTSSYVDASGTTQSVQTDSIADLNVLTFKGAQDAIAVIDNAINQISTLSANLGAFQTNVLQSNVTSLGVAQTNLSASLSTVEDTNLSTEIVDYTKNQILVQAATSALGQANQAPQAILKLLQ